jgi:hypothetical protein
MAVYVDRAVNAYGRMMMCHMLADTPEELHAMAQRIGIARRHYQSPMQASFPHYDICKAKRAQAILLGAVEIQRFQVSSHMRQVKQQLIGAGKTWQQTGWVP